MIHFKPSFSFDSQMGPQIRYEMGNYMCTEISSTRSPTSRGRDDTCTAYKSCMYRSFFLVCFFLVWWQNRAYCDCDALPGPGARTFTPGARRPAPPPGRSLRLIAQQLRAPRLLLQTNFQDFALRPRRATTARIPHSLITHRGQYSRRCAQSTRVRRMMSQHVVRGLPRRRLLCAGDGNICHYPRHICDFRAHNGYAVCPRLAQFYLHRR